MGQVFVYILKCTGALFAMFMMAGACASLYLGGREVTSENSAVVGTIMVIAAVVAATWFWPSWPSWQSKE